MFLFPFCCSQLRLRINNSAKADLSRLWPACLPSCPACLEYHYAPVIFGLGFLSVFPSYAFLAMLFKKVGSPEPAHHRLPFPHPGTLGSILQALSIHTSEDVRPWKQIYCLKVSKGRFLKTTLVLDYSFLISFTSILLPVVFWLRLLLTKARADFLFTPCNADQRPASLVPPSLVLYISVQCLS